jgi:hypothetical protein
MAILPRAQVNKAGDPSLQIEISRSEVIAVTDGRRHAV